MGIYTIKKEHTIPNKIKENIAYEKQLESEIKMKQKYLQAIQEQTLTYIHDLDAGAYFSYKTLQNSWYYSSSKNKRKEPKERKDSYNYLKHWLNRVLKDYKYKITEIISCGLSTYAYNINIDVSSEDVKRKLIIQIPLVDSINNIETREFTNDGRYIVFVEKSDSWRSQIGSTYKWEEIEDIVNECMRSGEIKNE